jgi:hypothetical protein
MPNLTLIEVINRNSASPLVGLIEDVTTYAPEWGILPAVRHPGTSYKVARRVNLPAIQFRAANQGVSTSVSKLKQEVKDMAFIDGIINIDEMVWDADAGLSGSLWEMETSGLLHSLSILIGQQTWYGTGADTAGFLGLRSQLSGSVQAGTGANTTSAYLIDVGGRNGVRYDIGENGNVALSEPKRQQVLDASLKPYFAWVGNLRGYVGLNVMSQFGVYAVTGINPSVTSTTNVLKDSQAQQLMASIPFIRQTEDLRWFMNKQAYALLQQSRTSVYSVGASNGYNYLSQTADASGRGAYSPAPTHLNGYPIHVSESILNNETN